jgi:inorganic pyrophosphatase
MTFPYDVGFVPSTKADDGDPVDVLVLMDEPAFAGRVLCCSLIGAIQGEQGIRKRRKRYAMTESSRSSRMPIAG